MMRALVAAILLCATALAHAQAYPSKSIRWIVPIAAGGTNDVASRLIAGHLATALGQPVVVENRPGAASIIGFDAAAKAPPDGYTIMSADNAFVINAALYKSLPYDDERDFVPVASYGHIPMLLVARAALAKDVGEAIALARAQPGKLTFGSAGKGSPHHLMLELIKQRTGVDFVHVPFKGGTPALLEIVAGRIDLGVSNFGSVMPHVEAGKVRVLGIAAPQRSPRYLNVPTFAESGGPDLDAAAWQGVFAPRGTPKAIVDRLNTEIRAILRQPEIVDKMGNNGVQVRSGTPEEFAAFLKNEREFWVPLIRSWKISME